jgi:hypothetical protein
MLAAVLIASPSRADACRAPSDSNGMAFPVKVQAGHRYLQNSAGAAFLLHGDTAWSLIAQLSREDADLYLRDRRARGFNTILVNLLERRFASNAPANAYGDLPFKVPGDFETPNEAYFSHADWVLRRACELGLLVLLAPAYAGNGGGAEGWYDEMVANGAQKLHAYGRFIGTRYRGLDNILWVAGGDYDPPDKSLPRAIVDGIREADPEALHTAHGSPGQAALDYWDGEPWLAVNNVYTYEPVHLAALKQFALHADEPFFLIESAYENEHGAGEDRVRMQAYHAILSGASGQVFGNNPIWHFDGPGLFPVTATWKEALDSRGARSMTVLYDIVSSVKWWLLEPDIGNAFLIGGRGLTESRAVAALASDGSLGLVYVPTSRTITLDLRRLAGSAIVARWVDPTNATSVAAEGSPFAPAVQKLKSPARNGAGFTDWVLELTTQTETGSIQ